MPRLPPATTTRRPSKSKAISCVLPSRRTIPGGKARRRADLQPIEHAGSVPTVLVLDLLKP